MVASLYILLVYQVELKNEHQKPGETLQQYEEKVARSVHVAYPAAPKDFLDHLVGQIFIDGVGE